MVVAYLKVTALCFPGDCLSAWKISIRIAEIPGE
jgi:hypothetical protein